MSASQPALFNVQEFTDNGITLVGGRLYTYTHGTTAHKTAYTDPAGAVPQTYTADGLGGQYIALNTRGELPTPLYLTSGAYDIALKRADGSSVWTRQAAGVEHAVSTLIEDLAAPTGSSLIGHGTGTVADALSANAVDIETNAQDIAAASLGIATIRNIVVGANLDPLVVDMHFRILCATGWLGDGTEPGGYEPIPAKATVAASAGNTSITVDNASSFRAGQLICYLALSSTWYSARVHSIAGGVLQLDREMPEGVSIGASVVFFYANDAHPNQYGYKAIVDDAIRQLGHKEEVAHIAPNYEAWSPFGASTVSGVTLGAISADSYAIPGATANSDRAARVDTIDINQGATSGWVSLPAGEYTSHVVVNSGERTGGFSGSVRIAVEEMRPNGISYGIATRDVSGYAGVRTIDLSYNVGAGSVVRVKVYSINTGAAVFYLGKLTHCRVIEHAASLNHGTHVLLGDSWFASGFLMSRLQERLPDATFVNKGVSGNRASDLLARFNADVRPSGAHFVWLMCGTNDYYAKVTPTLFEQQMRQIIGLTQSIAAQPIVFTASVGDALYAAPLGEQLTASREYAIEVGYHAHREFTTGVGAQQRTANFFAAITVPALGSAVLAVIPGRTALPAFLRYLSTNAAGLTIRVGYSGVIDATVLTDQSSIPSGTTIDTLFLPRTDNQLRFVLIVADNPSGAPLPLSLVADIAWTHA